MSITSTLSNRSSRSSSEDSSIGNSSIISGISRIISPKTRTRYDIPQEITINPLHENETKNLANDAMREAHKRLKRSDSFTSVGSEASHRTIIEKIFDYHQELKEKQSEIQYNNYQANRENSKNWAIQPVITADPSPLTKDMIFEDVTHGDIYKKYFTFVKYSDFLSTLNKTWQMAAKDLENTDYVVTCNTPNPEDHEERPTKSSDWITGLLLKHNSNFQPSDVVDCGMDDTITADDLKGKAIVIVDDCSFSGKQIEQALGEYLSDFIKNNIHIIIPFMSNKAKKRILRTIDNHGYEKAKIYTSEKIYHIKQKKHAIRAITDPLERDLIKNIKHTTLFEHKIADFESLGPVGAFIENKCQTVYSKEENTQSFYDYYKHE